MISNVPGPTAPRPTQDLNNELLNYLIRWQPPPRGGDRPRGVATAPQGGNRPRGLATPPRSVRGVRGVSGVPAEPVVPGVCC